MQKFILVRVLRPTSTEKKGQEGRQRGRRWGQQRPRCSLPRCRWRRGAHRPRTALPRTPAEPGAHVCAGPDWWHMGTGRPTQTALPSSASTKQSTQRRPGDRGLRDVDPGHRGWRGRLAEEQRAGTKAGSHSGQHPASSPGGSRVGEAQQ